MDRNDSIEDVRARVLGELERAETLLKEDALGAERRGEHERVASKTNARERVSEMIEALRVFPPNWTMLAIAGYLAEVGLVGGFIHGSTVEAARTERDHFEDFARLYLVERPYVNVFWIGYPQPAV